MFLLLLRVEFLGVSLGLAVVRLRLYLCPLASSALWYSGAAALKSASVLDRVLSLFSIDLGTWLMMLGVVGSYMDIQGHVVRFPVW